MGAIQAPAVHPWITGPITETNATTTTSQEQSHDWKDGARIGEAQNPGPVLSLPCRGHGKRWVNGRRYTKFLSYFSKSKSKLRMNSTLRADPPMISRKVKSWPTTKPRGGGSAVPRLGKRLRPPLMYLRHPPSCGSTTNSTKTKLLFHQRGFASQKCCAPQQSIWPSYRGEVMEKLNKPPWERICWFGMNCATDSSIAHSSIHTG